MTVQKYRTVQRNRRAIKSLPNNGGLKSVKGKRKFVAITSVISVFHFIFASMIAVAAFLTFIGGVTVEAF